MKESYIRLGRLRVAKGFIDFIHDEILPGLSITSEQFWRGIEDIQYELGPKLHTLLAARKNFQKTLDAWYANAEGSAISVHEHYDYLKEIGYIEPDLGDFQIPASTVDDEIARTAGPQLVVPVSNARYALNAANARWGSLYDALYGTDAILPAPIAGAPYDDERGSAVITFAKDWLDTTLPLSWSSHKNVDRYFVEDGRLVAALTGDRRDGLQVHEAFAGFRGEPGHPTNILLKHNGLHIDVQIDRQHTVGRTDPAGISDIILESAVTTIMDCEDSVAAVTPEEKVNVYRNWLGLMKGDLSTKLNKDGHTRTRCLNPDRAYTSPAGDSFELPGRSLMFVRNVGHLTTTDLILDADGMPVSEGIVDAAVTALAAMHDLQPSKERKNSRKGSIYIVKPKMHGPSEAAWSNDLLNRVEDMLELDRYTIKIGLMDEERRTSVNLKNCIHALKNRIVFINTGFLDRTGDEIHTLMQAGPVVRKADMKSETWLAAYEARNVEVGLACGFSGNAQIGKGMWAKPDMMSEMLSQKLSHPRSGASTAWVPSPTAATLHALHYHAVDVAARQREIASRTPTPLVNLLRTPIAQDPCWSDADIREELDNNAQGILGYVARWINQGIGCSKVPDIYNIGLMEDRATLRISSQHMANWIRHGICSETNAMEALLRMAALVDQQNASDPDYVPMGPDYASSPAFLAARDLVLDGAAQPNGYTELVLNRRRREFLNR